MAVDQNLANTPEHIIAACKRVLRWTREPKLRKNIEQRIEQLEKEVK